MIVCEQHPGGLAHGGGVDVGVPRPLTDYLPDNRVLNDLMARRRLGHSCDSLPPRQNVKPFKRSRPARQPIVSNEVMVAQPLPGHADSDRLHHVERVTGPDVVPSGELPDIAVQMLLAELVESALITPVAPINPICRRNPSIPGLCRIASPTCARPFELSLPWSVRLSSAARRCILRTLPCDSSLPP